jgi:hypothetical protein
MLRIAASSSTNQLRQSGTGAFGWESGAFCLRYFACVCRRYSPRRAAAISGSESEQRKRLTQTGRNQSVWQDLYKNRQLRRGNI